MSAFPPDIWLRPVVVDATNKVFKIIEDPTGIPNAVTVTLTEGTYYLHDDASWHATLPGLYYAIRNVLNSGSGADGTRSGTPAYTYSWEASTPTLSSGVSSAGLTLKATGAANPFKLDWTSGTTLDGRWLGYKDAAPSSDTTSTNLVLLTEVIVSDYCVWGRLRTFDLLDGGALNKDEKPRKIVERSSDRVADSITTNWGTEYDRRFLYEDIWPSMVDRNRAGNTPYATISGLAAGDKNNTWHYIWDALQDGKSCVVVHGAVADLQVDSHDWEIVKAVDDLEWDSFQSSIDDGGDLRRVDFRVAVLSGTYEH